MSYRWRKVFVHKFCLCAVVVKLVEGLRTLVFFVDLNKSSMIVRIRNRRFSVTEVTFMRHFKLE